MQLCSQQHQKIMKKLLLIAILCILNPFRIMGEIDRIALLTRNSPVITTPDTLSSLSVGNGAFAFTADITGLQTFPEYYRNGVPLGTQSQWGWHSFDNPDSLKIEESYREYDFGHGHTELYAAEFKEAGRQKDAATWYRVNPHRLHLGCIGLALPEGTDPESLTECRQTLDLLSGQIDSKFNLRQTVYNVSTVCHPGLDMISATVTTAGGDSHPGIILRFPYPTGAHADDACDWRDSLNHSTVIVEKYANSALLKRQIDNTQYYVSLSWENQAKLRFDCNNRLSLSADGDTLSFSARFSTVPPAENNRSFRQVSDASRNHWNRFWNTTGMVDFSDCTDPRARELERRVVLSQYLLAIQCAGDIPPQETGLTYNSWFGKHHLEMIWWHQSWLPLYGHPEMLGRTLAWYETVLSKAREIAARQGFKGCRWMKMTDPSGEESPSKVGSFLIWQQPHIIYLISLMQRAGCDHELIDRYGPMLDETATFMADFASREGEGYLLKGYIPAQETLKAETTYNSPFELSYWKFGLKEANRLREIRGLERVKEWDDIADRLPEPASDPSGLYLAAESAPATFSTLPLISDHPAMLGAFGVLPGHGMIDINKMKKTLAWVMANWNWGKTWGWDYPMTAMCAVRCGEPETAVEALLKDCAKNTYLPNGHNWQDKRLRCYLPGNGGLLTAIAMMCAGFDGSDGKNPGFPESWDVKWEGLSPLP